jgi:ATP-dependent helicase YprA (DUF1998 family)
MLLQETKSYPESICIELDSVLQYWQEVGRAGRDGNKSVAHYYATKTSILSVQDDMKKCIQVSAMGKLYVSERLFLNA